MTGAVLSADTGTSSTDFITDIAAQTISGTLSGNIAAGDSVYVSLNGGSTWTAATASVGANTWTLANATLLSGTNTLMVKVADAAGNTNSTVYSQSYTYSTTPPNFSSFVINSAITTDTASTNTALGVSGTTFGGTTPQNSDGITRDTSLVLTGSVSGVTTGDVLQYSSNGGTTWNNATLAGTGTTTWTVADVTAQTTTGTLTYTFRVMNTAGNIQTLSGTKSVTIDITAPTMTIKAPVLTSTQDSGTLGDNTTTATSLTFTSATQGTGEVGATVALISDVNNDGIYDPLVDKVLGSATVTSTGSWSITNSTALTTGAYNLGFVEYDVAGNYTRLTPTTTINIVTADGATATGGLSASGLAAWSSGSFAAGMTVGIGTNGNWIYGISTNYSVQTSLSAVTNTSLGAGQTGPQLDTFVDYNRDGYVDMVGGQSQYVVYWTGTSTGLNSTPTNLAVANDYGGGFIAWDQKGSGYVGFYGGDTYGSIYSANVVTNTNGVLSYTPTSIYKPGGTVVDTALAPDMEASGVDFDNNGTIDLAIHAGGNGSSFSSNTYQLLLIKNNGIGGVGGLTEVQGIDNVFYSTANTTQQASSMLWADFNHSGYLSLYVPASNYGNSSNVSYVYLNNGGTLSAGSAINCPSDNTGHWYEAAALVDWNHDGNMDIIRMDSGSSQKIELYTGNGAGGFTAGYLTSSGTTLSSVGAVQGISMVDQNWDGAVDLVYTTSGAINTILNTNAVQNGTSLNIKISDPGGVNSYFGNTVKLFDTTTGQLVSTQVLNEQSGFWTDNSTGILNFYGLNANDTYSVVMIRATGSTSNDVGGQSSYSDSSAAVLSTVENVDASWGGIKTSTANSAIDLIADGGASTSSTASYVGTGYNDTFFVENLNSASKLLSGSTVVTTEKFNGGGGWTLGLGGSASTWVTTGGMNVVDMTQAGSNAVVVNLNTGTGSVTTTGGTTIETLGFTSIQGIKLSAGTTTVTDGGSGDNEFWLGTGQAALTLGNATGHDVLVFQQLGSAAASGGFNAGNTVSGFTVGAVTTTAKSTILDLRGVLQNYAGTATVYWDVTTSKYVLDQDSQGLLQYLNIVVSGSNTLVQVDTTGSGNWQTIATLSGVSTNLATLIGNNQLWVGSNSLNLISVTTETTTSTTPIVQGTLDPSVTLAAGDSVQVTLNGTTYSSTTGAVVVDYTNHVWYVKPTSALAVGTYDVSAAVLNSSGGTISQDTTSNELTIKSVAVTTGNSVLATSTSNWFNNTSWSSSLAVGMDANGNLTYGVGASYIVQNSPITATVTTLSVYNNRNLADTFDDYNRDGYADLLGGLDWPLSYWNGTASGISGSPAHLRSGGAYVGGFIAWDKNGTGWADFYDGAATGGGTFFAVNTAGTLSIGTLTVYNSAGTAVDTALTTNAEASGVDFNNDGNVDLAIHAGASALSTNAYQLLLIQNNGTTNANALKETQAVSGVFYNTSSGSTIINSPMLWADFNHSGYLSLYVTSNQTSDTGTLYINAGGTLQAGQSVGYVLSSTSNYYAAGLIDWNHDGNMDIVRMDSNAANYIELDTGNGSGSFSASYLSSGGTQLQTTAAVTGLSMVDVNWDGTVDIVYSTANQINTILNPNAVSNGTSLNVKISDPNGIASYFGNTVKLFDTTTGTLVSTQVINEQSGLWTNDSTGILHFYGLNANDTYSVVMVRATNGVSNDVGGQASYSDSSATTLSTVENVDTTWGNIHTSTANSALDLVATGGANTSTTNSFVGTGYNDTLFAVSGTNASTYNGGGGWYTDSTGASVWTSAGGMNVLDFTKAGSSAVSLDLSSTSAQSAVSGWGTVTLANIEGVAGGSGNDTFTNSGGNDQMQGRGGNNTYNLTHAGGHDTLLYTVQTAASNTGGNGPDVANGFKVGVYETNADADVINLKALLVGYTAGTGAHYVNGVATIDSGETIGNYLTVTNNGSDTILSIDRDGTGSTYSSTALLTLHNVTTNLATLMANHQIIVA